jgi:four helix bundle protein
LEKRTFEFSKNLVCFCRQIAFDNVNKIIINQLVRSGCSVGANYCEANDCLGKKDFVHRLRISRKESKETIYWLKLMSEISPLLKPKIGVLLDECTQIKNILSVIIRKIELKNV